MTGTLTGIGSGVAAGRNALGLWEIIQARLRRRPLRILRPEEEVQHREFVEIAGDGCPQGWRVFVLSALVHHQTWLQPQAVEPDPHGEWVHPKLQLYVCGDRGERYVYALAVRQKDIELVAEQVGRAIASISELDRWLQDHNVKRRWSQRKRLVRASP